MDDVNDPQSRLCALGLILFVPAFGCRVCNTQSKMPEFTVFDPNEQRQRDRSGTVTGRDGITIFGTGNSEAAAAGGGRGLGRRRIGVNAYLWRGALEPSTSCRWPRPTRSVA